MYVNALIHEIVIEGRGIGPGMGSKVYNIHKTMNINMNNTGPLTCHSCLATTKRDTLFKFSRYYFFHSDFFLTVLILLKFSLTIHEHVAHKFPHDPSYT